MKGTQSTTIGQTGCSSQVYLKSARDLVYSGCIQPVYAFIDYIVSY